jgi:hypothetical protein
MECEGDQPLYASMLTSVPYFIVQVQMGILPVGNTPSLLPTEPPPISERIT